MQKNKTIHVCVSLELAKGFGSPAEHQHAQTQLKCSAVTERR